MATKEQRSVQARNHISRVKGIFETDIKKSLEGIQIYEDGDTRDVDLDDARFEKTDAYTVWTDILKALSTATGKVCVVDPANFTKPGGGYVYGSWDIESQLCSESNLFAILEGMESVFHAGNYHYVRGGINSDRAVYIEGVIFTSGGNMRTCDVLAISPVNRKKALESNRSEAECDYDMRNRVASLMNIAAKNQVDTLVLSDFGCGYMGNDGKIVAGLFKEWLDEHPGQLENVVFAIAGGPALDDFKEVFPEKLKESVVEEVTRTDVPEDDDVEVDVEPVSEGRWVFD